MLLLNRTASASDPSDTPGKPFITLGECCMLEWRTQGIYRDNSAARMPLA